MQIEIQNMIDFAPFPLSIFDSKGTLIKANSHWISIFDIKIKTEYKFDHLDFLKNYGINVNFKKLLRKNETSKSLPVPFEYIPDKRSGKFRNHFYTFHINNISDSKDKKYLIIMALDVTDELNRVELNNELNNLAQNSASILTVLENERKRIAKDLHDSIGQKLVVAKLNLEYFQKQNDEKIEEIEKTKQHIQEISKDIKLIIHNLHPVIIDKYNLTDALNNLVQNFNIESDTRTTIQFFGKYSNEDKNINLNIYRILQEALNNILKHSEADRVNIQLHFSEETITGLIEDNGKGFNEDILRHDKNRLSSYGILSMRERARACGGDFTIESIPSEGTKIIFHIPLRGS